MILQKICQWHIYNLVSKAVLTKSALLAPHRYTCIKLCSYVYIMHVYIIIIYIQQLQKHILYVQVVWKNISTQNLLRN